MSRLEQYHVLGQIGEGSFGKVHKGRVRLSGQIVALKFINKRGRSEKDLANLRQEIDILRGLRHQNIVHLIEAFETSAQFVLVTELAHGQLYDIIESDKTLSEEDVRVVARQLIHALNYLHYNRVIHRDIKPHNILIGADRAVKLCDFGFAKFVDFQSHALTSVKGTPLYMAPELISSTPYKHVVDLWSLGVILYELYFGHPPFHSNSWMELFQIIKNEPLRIPDPVDPDFKDLVKGLLNKVPDERLQWPALFTHPFIKKNNDKDPKPDRRSLLRNNFLSQSRTPSRSRSRTPLSLVHERDLSPLRAPCQDSVWSKYQQRAQDPKQASSLRSDLDFHSKMKQALTTEHKSKDVLRSCLKCMKLALLQKAKDPASDFARDQGLGRGVILCIKRLIQEGGSWGLVSLAVTDYGLLSKHYLSRQKKCPIQRQGCQQFLQLGVSLLQVSGHEQSQSVLINTMKVVGLFANHASQSLPANSWFFKAVLALVQPLKKLFAQSTSVAVTKYVFHVFSVFLYPIYGQLQGFPYAREYVKPEAISEQLESAYAARDAIVALVSAQGFSLDFFLSGQSITRLSILRTVLQVVRRSASLTQTLMGQIVGLLDASMQPKTDALEYVLCGSIIGVIADQQRPLLILLLKTIRKRVPALLQRLEKGSSVGQTMATLNILRALMFGQSAGTISAYLDGNLLGLMTELWTSREGLSGQEEQVLKAVGSCYGFPWAGLHDPAVLLLQRHLFLMFKAGQTKFSEKERGQLVSGLMAFFGLRSYGLELSPRAVCCLLEVIQDLSRIQQFSCKFTEEQVRWVYAFAKPAYLRGLRSYPGASSELVGQMVDSIYKMGQMLSCPSLLRVTQEALPLLLDLAPFLPEDRLQSLCQLLLRVLSGADSKTALDSQRILNVLQSKQLLRADGRWFTEGVSVLTAYMKWADCQVKYAMADRVVDWSMLRAGLGQGPQLRAKLCSLVGCLTKNSGYYYGVVKSQFIPDVITCCTDVDPAVRRQAFFAVGNSAFHSADLYQDLRPAVPALVRGLSDPDEKLRFNAAAALCNMARNGGQLIREMVQKGAVRALVRMVREDVVIAKRSALVCLSNIMQYGQGRSAGVRQNAETGVREVLGGRFGTDPQIAKYGRRILEKLDY